MLTFGQHVPKLTKFEGILQ